MKLEPNDLSFNLDKWNFTNSNVLFVTGLSGSGKSTIAEQISKDTKCRVIRLDDFRNNQNTSTFNLVEKFKKEYPETDKYFKNHWNDNETFEHYFLIYLSFVLEYINNDRLNLYVVEGIQLYLVPYKDKWFTRKPLIIKGTDVNECYRRQISRGSTKLNNVNRLKKDQLFLNSFKKKYSKTLLIERFEITNFMRKF